MDYKPLPNSDWLTLQGKKFFDCDLTLVRLQLNEVTALFANYNDVRAKQLEASRNWTRKASTLRAWRIRTSRVREIVCGTRRKVFRGSNEISTIMGRYFSSNVTKEEFDKPQVLLGRLMDGIVAASSFVENSGPPANLARQDAEIYFLWVCVIFRILRDAKIPVRHPSRKQLISAPISLVTRLQNTLPSHLRRRQGAATEAGRRYREEQRKGAVADSLRKTCLNAYHLSTLCDVQILRAVFNQWTAGNLTYARDYANDIENDPLFPFIFNFEKRFEIASGRTPRRIGAS